MTVEHENRQEGLNPPEPVLLPGQTYASID